MVLYIKKDKKEKQGNERIERERGERERFWSTISQETVFINYKHYFKCFSNFALTNN